MKTGNENIDPTDSILRDMAGGGEEGGPPPCVAPVSELFPLPHPVNGKAKTTGSPPRSVVMMERRKDNINVDPRNGGGDEI